MRKKGGHCASDEETMKDLEKRTVVMVGWVTLERSNGKGVDLDLELRPPISGDSDLSPIIRHEGNRRGAPQVIRNERGGASQRVGA